MNGAPIKVDLSGKVALITGGASGIGRACAELLGANGARIAIGDLNLAGAQEVCASMGSDALAIAADVADSASVQAMVDATLGHFGQIDILVHCAGGAVARKDVVDLTDEEWDRAIRVNLYGAMYVMRAVARIMIAQTYGTMLTITSDRGLYGDKSRAAYAAAKGGDIALVKTLALELGQYQITVNALNPGTTNTPPLRSGAASMREQRIKADPLGKLSEPEEIAEMVLFLTGPAAKFMTGQLITTRMRFG